LHDRVTKRGQGLMDKGNKGGLSRPIGSSPRRRKSTKKNASTADGLFGDRNGLIFPIRHGCQGAGFETPRLPEFDLEQREKIVLLEKTDDGMVQVERLQVIVFFLIGGHLNALL